jgi:hypothetical protein
LFYQAVSHRVPLLYQIQLHRFQTASTPVRYKEEKELVSLPNNNYIKIKGVDKWLHGASFFQKKEKCGADLVLPVISAPGS